MYACSHLPAQVHAGYDLALVARSNDILLYDVYILFESRNEQIVTPVARPPNTNAVQTFAAVVTIRCNLSLRSVMNWQRRLSNGDKIIPIFLYPKGTLQKVKSLKIYKLLY